MKINKRKSKIFLSITAIILIGVLCFGLLAYWEKEHGVTDVVSELTGSAIHAGEEDTVFYEGRWYTKRQGIETVLVIGVDKYIKDTLREGYNNEQQADFLMLLILDNKAETYTLLPINRDTMAEISILGLLGEQAGSFTGQLALSHTYGSGGNDSCINTVEAVSNFLYGLTIDHYVSFTMDTVSAVTDFVGGVTITLAEDFTAYNPLMVKGATIRLNGDMARAYVTFRKELDDSSNLGRMARQQIFLEALQRTFKSGIKIDDGFWMHMLGVVSQYMESDCTVAQLNDLCERSSGYEYAGSVDIEGEAVRGEEFIEFYADEGLLMEMIVHVFYK